MNARHAPYPVLARATILAAAAVAVAALSAAPRIVSAAQDSGKRSASATFNVVARVVAVLKVRAVRQPARLEVSAQDVLRGYVDVDGAIAVEIATNLRDRFGLRLHAVHPVASAASFRGVATPLHAVGHEDGLSIRRVAGDPIVTTLTADARIMLAPGTAPGTYPWPVAIAAHAN